GRELRGQQPARRRRGHLVEPAQLDPGPHGQRTGDHQAGQEHPVAEPHGDRAEQRQHGPDEQPAARPLLASLMTSRGIGEVQPLPGRFSGDRPQVRTPHERHRPSHALSCSACTRLAISAWISALGAAFSASPALGCAAAFSEPSVTCATDSPFNEARICSSREWPASCVVECCTSSMRPCTEFCASSAEPIAVAYRFSILSRTSSSDGVFFGAASSVIWVSDAATCSCIFACSSCESSLVRSASLACSMCEL